MTAMGDELRKLLGELRAVDTADGKVAVCKYQLRDLLRALLAWEATKCDG